MGKISPVSAKYIIDAIIHIEGAVDKPDVIGAVFGQTEGLLGNELELRELQRSGKIGRIEVKLDTKNGKTDGFIVIPSSLDKVETSVIAAAIETIQKIGPCESKVKIQSIEDVRISKRGQVIERAKELLKNLTDTTLPDSQELTDEVAHSVRVMEIVEYGKDRLPAGPAIDEADEIIIVEGRADVLNLLKNGIKNVVGVGGTNIPETIIELSKRKVVTVFVDGDRGGEIIIKGLLGVTDIDYIVRAPDGKEVEEITKKEIHKALRNRVAVEQIKMELKGANDSNGFRIKKDEAYGLKPVFSFDSDKASGSKPGYSNYNENRSSPIHRPRTFGRPNNRYGPKQYQRRFEQAYSSYKDAKEVSHATHEEKEIFKEKADDLIGTRGAYIFDKDLNVLGKVPVSELSETIKSLNSIYAIVMDGDADRSLVKSAERKNVKYIVANVLEVKQNETNVCLLKSEELRV